MTKTVFERLTKSKCVPVHVKIWNRTEIKTGARVTGLHFKHFKSFWTNCVHRFKAKNCFKHDKQRHLVSKMKFEIFFVKAQVPFYNYTIVLGRGYYPVKIDFSAFPPLDITLINKTCKLLCNILHSKRNMI